MSGIIKICLLIGAFITSGIIGYSIGNVKGYEEGIKAGEAMGRIEGLYMQRYKEADKGND